MAQSKRKTRPASPFRSGYKMFAGVIDKEVTVEQVKAALPRHAELWDGRDGTKAVTVKRIDGKPPVWQIRIIARGGSALHMPTLFE